MRSIQSMSIPLAELARNAGCEVHASEDPLISGASSIEDAAPGSIVFALNDRILDQAETCSASAILLSSATRASQRPTLRAKNIRLAWANILNQLYPPDRPRYGIHPTSAVDTTASVHPSAEVGPFCAIGAGASIGERCILKAGVCIGANASIESDSILHERVIVGERCVIGPRNILHPGAVVGADGFGFARDGARYHRIPQVGIVHTGCDVEIGANATIDRAALGETVLADGVKVDNLVQIGHNCRIGANTLIAALTGLSGSVTVDPSVTMAGQVGIADHLHIGEGAILGGRAGVIGDVPARSVLVGFPARPRREFFRSIVLTDRLPALMKEIDALRQLLHEHLHSPLEPEVPDQ